MSHTTNHVDPNDRKTNAVRSLRGIGIAVIVLLGVGACSWLLIDILTANRKKWVHPEITGTVIEKSSENPIPGAVVKLVNSKFEGRQTVSTASGEFTLGAVSKRYFFQLPMHGDERLTTEIECSALNYETRSIQLRHGSTGVWDNDSPEVISIVISLVKIP